MSPKNGYKSASTVKIAQQSIRICKGKVEIQEQLINQLRQKVRPQ